MSVIHSFAGSVTLPASSNVTFGGTSHSTILGLYAPTASPTFTGTVTSGRFSIGAIM
jgi:hypothetical protein